MIYDKSCHVLDHLYQTTNKQTNALSSIKTPTMSSIINKKNHSIQLIHIIFFSLDRTMQKKTKTPQKKQITFSKKYSYNGCILVLSSTETHSIHNLIKADF